MLKKIEYWLLNPWIILLGIVVGVTVGLTDNSLHFVFNQLGMLYLQLLQMCIFPTVVVAVIVSVGNLLHSHIADYVWRLFLVLFIGMTLAALVTVLLSTLVHGWDNLNAESQAILGKKLAEIQGNSASAIAKSPATQSIWDFINSIIPTNIFKSLSNGDSLPVLIFSIIFGIALGCTKSNAAKTALSALDGFYNALLRLVGWLMYALPFGLCFMFGGLMSRLGFEIFTPLSMLILLFVSICLLLGMVNGFVLARRTKSSFFQAIKAIRAPVFVALGTSSSFAALPATLQSLQEELKFDRKLIGLFVPIGINFYQIGNIVKYVLITIFIAHLYGKQLDYSEYVMLYITSMIMSITASGAPGITVVSMFAIMLQPLGLPILPGVALLTMLDPLLDPLVTALNVIGNCAVASLVVPPHKEIARRNQEARESFVERIEREALQHPIGEIEDVLMGLDNLVKSGANNVKDKALVES